MTVSNKHRNKQTQTAINNTSPESGKIARQTLLLQSVYKHMHTRESDVGGTWRRVVAAARCLSLFNFRFYAVFLDALL